MSSVRRLLVATVALCTAGVLLPTAAVAEDEDRSGRLQVLLDDLLQPKGVTTVTNGVVVAQGAFGTPGPEPDSEPVPVLGPVLEYRLGGPQRGTTIELTEPASAVDVAAAPDGAGWALVPGGGADEGTWLLYRAADGTITPVVDIAAYQATDPDPADQDVPPFPTESNPYGLASTLDGDALVTDAANNDLLRVTPAGQVTTVARFGTESILTNHLPADHSPPVAAAIDAEAVPTTVTIGPDGYAYVGELKGFPFRPGSSRIWRINPEADGAQCTVGATAGGCEMYARGFTGIQDIAFNRNTGTLYVYELAEDGVLAFEAGFATGAFPAAVLLMVRGDHRTELLRGQLSQPGGVAVNRRGRVFVTDQVFTEGGGRLSRVQPWDDDDE